MAERLDTCTCGKCFEGWLSPRMRERLEYSSELRYGLAKQLLDTQDGVSADVTRTLSIDYAQIDIAFYYLPPELREKISSSDNADAPSGDAIYRGYVAVFKVVKHLATADADSDKPRGFPTVPDVSKRLTELVSSKDAAAEAQILSPKAREHLAAFLDKGGSAEYALDCIVDRAREELSPLGSLYDAEKQYIDAILDGIDGEERPECPNDLDFALVRVKLGLPLETRGIDISHDEQDAQDPLSDEDE
ncbi:hypothetical protein BV20DRAFT_973582 [Pilatotrama ljubarskyi]|nr:hypothetical protein BV20DRAFT_973582 [Pilatotrama ljubarskyi]